MAKKVKSDEEELNEMIAKESNPDHFKPQEEPKGLPPRPSAISKDHLKPQEEPKEELNKAKVINPKHLKPQE